MTSELQKRSSLQPASFVLNNRPDTLQVKLIVELISNSINERRPITHDDIALAYAKWKARDGIIPVREYSPKLKAYRFGWTWEDYFEERVGHFSCKQWFKSNLGLAIIKGRLLAIPVIEI